VVTTDTYIRAKKDKPGHCCACECLPGLFCTRWWVLSASGISQCGWSFLEDGVLVKYDPAFRAPATRNVWRWFRFDDTVPITYTVRRFVTGPNDGWRVEIFTADCNVTANVLQAKDEQLWQGADDIPFTATGPGCFGTPIDVLNAASYGTIDAAQVDFPDLQDWDWAF